MFRVLFSAIKVRSTSGTRVYGMGWLKRRGGEVGGVSNCGGWVINPILP